MTKGKNKKIDRKVQRSREKGSDMTKEIPLGRACRRNWGGGKAR